ncbi:MAG TPA: exodeoxyribonuclease VII large subunit [Pseudogracilibacillus sp.]|nr:exodeoxyribonuclease VII large subunit [Pseudogracilibacillus sp.]
MENRYLSVSALTKYIKQKIERDPHLQTVYLKGEISNFSHHSRGHMYLTIKDNQAQIRAVMFAGNNRNLKFVPENGMEVLIKGNLGVYEPHGQYQLYIREMQPDGIGALYLAFEQLKEKLREKGYFNVDLKKDIPKYPNHIAIITSPTGAAVRDILTTLKRRYPIAKTTIIPTLVQGELAIDSIVNSINLANKINEYDCIILSRGGGSIEDLWAFNDIKVAEAIYRSKIPIITGIGHETDVTISDYISDLRAPTPTGAAELAVPSLIELMTNNQQYQERLFRSITQLFKIKQNKLNELQTSYVFKNPLQFVLTKEQYLDQTTDKLKHNYQRVLSNKQTQFSTLKQQLYYQHPERKLSEAKHKLNRLKELNKHNFERIFTYNENKFTSSLDKLILLNPLATMKRGFSLIYKENETQLVKSINDVEKNDKVDVQLNDGKLLCEVIDKRSEEIG